jgi:hypothetical protein
MEWTMTRSSRLLFGAALSLLFVATAPVAGAADSAAAPTDVSKSAGPDACANTPDEAAKQAAREKRDEALADLGRRLAADAATEEGGISLNRTGHNYGPEDAPTAPPASAR